MHKLCTQLESKPGLLPGSPGGCHLCLLLSREGTTTCRDTPSLPTLKHLKWNGLGVLNPHTEPNTGRGLGEPAFCEVDQQACLCCPPLDTRITTQRLVHPHPFTRHLAE